MLLLLGLCQGGTSSQRRADSSMTAKLHFCHLREETSIVLVFAEEAPVTTKAEYACWLRRAGVTARIICRWLGLRK
jgi:hypothetical protein